MKLFGLLGLVAAVVCAHSTTAAANNSHLVLNGFSEEVHASDGYEGILGTGARSVS
jgi:hypothetical protein